MVKPGPMNARVSPIISASIPKMSPKSLMPGPIAATPSFTPSTKALNPSRAPESVIAVARCSNSIPMVSAVVPMIPAKTWDSRPSAPRTLKNPSAMVSKPVLAERKKFVMARNTVGSLIQLAIPSKDSLKSARPYDPAALAALPMVANTVPTLDPMETSSFRVSTALRTQASNCPVWMEVSVNLTNSSDNSVIQAVNCGRYFDPALVNSRNE